MLALDRTMRTYGIYRLAAADAAELPADVHASLDAYAAGVNAWLEENEGALPPEFYALWIDPEPWTVTDSLVWIRLMALRLTDNWHTELLRATLRRHLTEPQLRALFPDPEPSGPTTLAAVPTKPPRAMADDLPSSAAMTDAWRDLGANWAARGGSNAWVLSDRKSTRLKSSHYCASRMPSSA